MNKKFTKLIAALALLVFMTPSLAGWGQSKTETTLFEEAFNKCNGTGGNDDVWSNITGSTSLSDSYTDNSGWSSTLGYVADKCARFGTGSNKGSAETPSISFTGDATLTFKAAAWDGNDEQIDLILSADGGTLKQNGQTISSVSMIKGAWTTFTIQITGVTSSVKVTFAGKNKSKSRFFLDEVKVTQEVSTEPSITVGSNPPESITVDYGEHSSYQYGDLTPLAVTYENITISAADDFAVQFYDGNGANPNELNEGDEGYPAWVSSATVYKVGTDYKLGLWIEQNDGDERYAYLKVYALGDDYNLVYSDFVTITQTARPAPSIAVTPSSLTGFTYQHNAGPSAAQSFAASGSNLTANVTVSVPADGDFEICATTNGTYGSSLLLTQSEGTLASTNVYVRLKAGKNIGENYSGTVTLSSDGATNQTVSLSGSVTGYSVTYDGNGSMDGEVPTDVIAYTYSQSVTVLGNTGTLVKTGHTFAGWNTQVDGNGTNYAAGASFNITANTTLYAKWTVNTHNVTLPTANTYGNYTMDKENPVAYGTEVTLTYTPAAGYEAYAATWSVNGNAISDNKFNMPDEDVMVTVTLTEHVAEFTNGFYSETMTNPDSFNNMQSVSVTGTGTWSYNSTYTCAFIKNSDAQEDWLITPRMQVDNGKLNVSFDIWHKNLETNGIALKWSASNSTTGTWHDIGFNKLGESSWRTISNLVIETGDAEYVYLAFVYKNENTSNAQCQIKNLEVRQYYNVTFDANIANASGSMSPLSCLTNTATPLTANVFTAQGKAFNGWNTQPDGLGTSYTDGANITITQNTTLYAQWADAYTVTFTTNGHADGTKTVISGDAIGTLPTPTADFIPTGYDFTGWYNGNLDVNGSSDAPVYIASDDEPTADVTLRAVFAEVVTPAGPETWTKITDLSTVTDGVYALIDADGYAFNGTMNDNHGQPTSSAFSFNQQGVAATAPTGTCELTLEATSNSEGYKMYDAVHGYLYASAASTKNLKWHDSETSYWKWSSNTGDNGNWVYVGSNYTARLRVYNHTFRTYGSDNGDPLYMAKKTPGTPAVYGNYYTFSGTITTITENTTRTTDIPMNEFVTVTNGATLTFSGSNLGTAENLIIEDGGQLIHGSAGVKATVKKLVKSFDDTEEGGWKVIASPLTETVTATAVNNLIDATPANYGLFYYDEPDHMWYNYKQNQNNTNLHTGFSIEPGKGYLYAKNSDVMIEFVGEMSAAEDPYVISNLSHESTGTNSNGFNLVGNPFTYTVYANQPFYIPSDDILATIDQYWTVGIAPGSGIMVQATEDNNYSVTFTRTAPDEPTKGSVQMTLSRSTTNRGGVTKLDKAIVSFNEGSQLGKFYLGESAANIYIPKGNEEFAIVSTEAQGEMPVNFRAAENGTYTLSIDAENVEMNYLHLIDNMTGMDIDLLQTPSYTFEATTRDYESRFRLVFAANNEDGVSTGSTAFAFFSNGNWIINNDGEAILQVIDITGRILSSESVNGSVSTTLNATPGVYMLRLINGENVKVQKIVVR